ncbi:unnamed protein product [Cunninghamella echinulata]
MKKISATEINKLLEELKINFEIIDKCLFVYLIYGFSSHFTYKRYEDGTEMEPIRAVIKSGLVEYTFENFYEVMLWYRYYSCKRHHVVHTMYNGPAKPSLKANAAYFARLPKYYRNTPPNKGLSIVKEAMIYFITHYNGIPPYFDQNYLDEEICKIID